MSPKMSLDMYHNIRVENIFPNMSQNIRLWNLFPYMSPYMSHNIQHVLFI